MYKRNREFWEQVRQEINERNDDLYKELFLSRHEQLKSQRETISCRCKELDKKQPTIDRLLSIVESCLDSQSVLREEQLLYLQTQTKNFTKQIVGKSVGSEWIGQSNAFNENNKIKSKFTQR